MTEPAPPPSSPLSLFNSLTRKIETFAPIEPGKARVYSCGPTVYNYAHLGNLRAYVFTDTLRRTLLWKGYAVEHIINITDVGHLTSDADAGDDKMEAAARREAKSVKDITDHYTSAFKQNIADLNIMEPSEWTVATDYVPRMIEFAEKIAPQHCYELDSGLYFDTSTVPNYGALAGAESDEHQGRIDPVPGKRNPRDFAIWRKSPANEQRLMEWDSPWGKGAPGWHLECSVMSLDALGQPFDIHTGGIDHREIHHPCEIAQNQAYSCTGHTGANWWMHNNFLVDRTGKMSKSKGEFLTLQRVIDRGIHPLAYRLLCLQAHYRSELEFSWENLCAALTRLKRIVRDVQQLKLLKDAWLWRNNEIDRTPEEWLSWDLEGKNVPSIRKKIEDFGNVIGEDLNTAKALTIFDDVIKMPRVETPWEFAAACMLDRVLGLNLLTLTRADLRIRPADATITEAEIESELDRRKQARAAKDFATSDGIRDELTAQGVEVMDGDPLAWDWKITLN